MTASDKKTQTLDPKPHSPKFFIQEYQLSQNQEQYIQQILLANCLNQKINTQLMNFGLFSEIIHMIPVTLKVKQMYEVYLYATYESSVSQKDKQKIPQSIINLQNNKINLGRVAKWLQMAISKNKLSFVNNKTNRKLSYPSHVPVQKSSIQKLPYIKSNPQHRFKQSLVKALNIFSEIQKQRQNAGLEAVALEEEEQTNHTQPTYQIHYDGDFFEVNAKINKLRSQAISYIEDMIDAAKDDKKLKKQFQEALFKYEKVRTQANQKIGRGASMKAQKRMIDNQKELIRKLNKWKVDNKISVFESKYF